MTAGSYADAAGLVQRSAAAYAAAVPVTPGLVVRVGSKRVVRVRLV